uniref:lysophospholipid acyltransferase LPEAT1-like n=1 Tax=Erigeron canadensis TaxID=72917 RepID=UPI001CB933FF|nr:lysophospholipid acyltransferase LPEAT1-like [Erigeron canadensis]
MDSQDNNGAQTQTHHHDQSNLEDGRHTTTNVDNSPFIITSPDDIQELHNKYAPYARHDMYGTMGRGKLPWTQKIRLAIAVIVLFPLRVVVGTLVVVLYYLICKACTLFKVPNREEDNDQEDYAHMGGFRRKIICWFGRLLSRALLFVFGFYWIKESIRNPDIDNKFDNEMDANGESKVTERPGVIISNHVSHLDILYHMSSSFPSFVAKKSVSELPLIGLISKCLGCIFVQREPKSSDFKGVSGVVNDRINESLQDKSAPMVMLFPEGTTTNGDYILPFKTGAFLSKAPVLPVILRYPYQKFSPAWDTITGTRHVILLLCQFVNYITVTRLPLYHPSQEEKENPKLYAENVRRLMAREGNVKMSDIGLAEKRVYHTAVHGEPTVFHAKVNLFSRFFIGSFPI